MHSFFGLKGNKNSDLHMCSVTARDSMLHSRAHELMYGIAVHFLSFKKLQNYFAICAIPFLFERQQGRVTLTQLELDQINFNLLCKASLYFFV